MLRNGKRVRSELLELRGLASHSHLVRVGLIVPRHHQTAVARNRLKRRIRELVRIDVLPRITGLEFVVRASPAAYRASVADLRNTLVDLVLQLTTKVC